MNTEVWLSNALIHPVTIIGTHFIKDQRIKPGDLISTLRDASGSITRTAAESGGQMVADPLPVNSVFGQAVPVAKLAPVTASEPVRATATQRASAWNQHVCVTKTSAPNAEAKPLTLSWRSS